MDYMPHITLTPTLPTFRSHLMPSSLPYTGDISATSAFVYLLNTLLNVTATQAFEHAVPSA